MYYVKKRFTICGAHKLKLSYESECTTLHGHNWVVDVYLKSCALNKDGMIMDFDIITKTLKDKLDHKTLNDVVDFNPTAENLAKYICDLFSPHCYQVDVEESAGNVASYIV